MIVKAPFRHLRSLRDRLRSNGARGPFEAMEIISNIRNGSAWFAQPHCDRGALFDEKSKEITLEDGVAICLEGEKSHVEGGARDRLVFK